jgi:hypothetical protein
MPYKDPELRKLKQAGYSKSYYEKNKKEVIAKINAKKKLHKEWFAEFKATKSCADCGESRTATLDFHHTDPKSTDRKVHKLVSDGHTKLRIQKEIDKCIVLCSNCHRIHHHEERENKRKLVAKT